MDGINEAQDALDTSQAIPLRGLQLSKEGGIVIIRGTVPTFYMKQLAQETIRHKINGSQMKNALEVSR